MRILDHAMSECTHAQLHERTVIQNLWEISNINNNDNNTNRCTYWTQSARSMHVHAKEVCVGFHVELEFACLSG